MEGRDRRTDHGFTLVELVVVMIVIGLLAAIAVPALLTNKSRAQEAAVKSDIKQIAKEVVGYYIDATGPLTVDNSADGASWLVRDSGGDLVATGPLSQRNAVVTAGAITSSDTYCISILPNYANARAWQATSTGLELGSC